MASTQVSKSPPGIPLGQVPLGSRSGGPDGVGAALLAVVIEVHGTLRHDALIGVDGGGDVGVVETHLDGIDGRFGVGGDDVLGALRPDQVVQLDGLTLPGGHYYLERVVLALPRLHQLHGGVGVLGAGVHQQQEGVEIAAGVTLRQEPASAEVMRPDGGMATGAFADAGLVIEVHGPLADDAAARYRYLGGHLRPLLQAWYGVEVDGGPGLTGDIHLHGDGIPVGCEEPQACLSVHSEGVLDEDPGVEGTAGIAFREVPTGRAGLFILARRRETEGSRH